MLFFPFIFLFITIAMAPRAVSPLMWCYRYGYGGDLKTTTCCWCKSKHPFVYECVFFFLHVLYLCEFGNTSMLMTANLFVCIHSEIETWLKCTRTLDSSIVTINRHAISNASFLKIFS